MSAAVEMTALLPLEGKGDTDGTIMNHPKRMGW